MRCSLRKDHVHLFSSTELFYRAVQMISTNHYRAAVRNFIFDLFDVKLGASTVNEFARIEESLIKRRDASLNATSDHLAVPRLSVSVSTVGNGPPSRSRALTVSSTESADVPAKAARLEPRNKQLGFAVPNVGKPVSATDDAEST